MGDFKSREGARTPPRWQSHAVGGRGDGHGHGHAEAGHGTRIGGAPASRPRPQGGPGDQRGGGRQLTQGANLHETTQKHTHTHTTLALGRRAVVAVAVDDDPLVGVAAAAGLRVVEVPRHSVRLAAPCAHTKPTVRTKHETRRTNQPLRRPTATITPSPN